MESKAFKLFAFLLSLLGAYAVVNFAALQEAREPGRDLALNEVIYMTDFHKTVTVISDDERN